METDYIRDNLLDNRSRRRPPLGNLIVRLATLFAMICTIATLVMLIGK